MKENIKILCVGFLITGVFILFCALCSDRHFIEGLFINSVNSR